MQSEERVGVQGIILESVPEVPGLSNNCSSTKSLVSLLTTVSTESRTHFCPVLSLSKLAPEQLGEPSSIDISIFYDL